MPIRKRPKGIIGVPLVNFYLLSDPEDITVQIAGLAIRVVISINPNSTSPTACPNILYFHCNLI